MLMKNNLSVHIQYKLYHITAIHGNVHILTLLVHFYLWLSFPLVSLAHFQYLQTSLSVNICDRISENGSKSHIFISLYLLLLHEHYYIFYIISYHYMEFNAQIIKTVQ